LPAVFAEVAIHGGVVVVAFFFLPTQPAVSGYAFGISDDGRSFDEAHFA